MWINEAVTAGARRAVACREVEPSVRTWQRWQTSPEDRRTTAIRPAPANRLSVEEEQQIRAVSHHPEYASPPPSQIVPRLADKGVYLASESTFYRVLRRHGEVHHRGRRLKSSRVKPPTTFTASGPCQVWTRDITWLPSVVRGRWYCAGTDDTQRTTSSSCWRRIVTGRKILSNDRDDRGGQPE
ncbi:helix-turn-helix domain-containing protein [Serratia oryzae]|uniref:helix-turn-helix domain-containing protein n=1 Tax=Serratia oryzae TaxID=2034155 RepID=UPI0012E1786E|nr:helix-turn-helix domain-containing protein [Serratia oryzae]